jgi:hypothetical protein
MENSTIQLGSTVVRTVAAQQLFQPTWPFGPWPETGEGSVHGTRRRLESDEPVARGGGECSLGRCWVHRESDLGFGARGISPARVAPWWHMLSGEEWRLGRGVAGGGGTRWTNVRRSALAWCEEE